MELTKLVSVNSKLNAVERFVGASIVSGGSLALMGAFVASWWPVVFIAIPAVAVSVGILIGGVNRDIKWRYFNAITAERDSTVKRYKGTYPSLFEAEWEKFRDSTNRFKDSALLKSVLTGKEIKMVLEKKNTDGYGGYVENHIVLKGYNVTVGEKHYPSDIEMWSSAFENASKLK